MHCAAGGKSCCYLKMVFKFLSSFPLPQVFTWYLFPGEARKLWNRLTLWYILQPTNRTRRTVKFTEEREWNRVWWRTKCGGGWDSEYALFYDESRSSGETALEQIKFSLTFRTVEVEFRIFLSYRVVANWWNAVWRACYVCVIVQWLVCNRRSF